MSQRAARETKPLYLKPKPRLAPNSEELFASDEGINRCTYRSGGGGSRTAPDAFQSSSNAAELLRPGIPPPLSAGSETEEQLIARFRDEATREAAHQWHRTCASSWAAEGPWCAQTRGHRTRLRRSTASAPDRVKRVSGVSSAAYLGNHSTTVQRGSPRTSGSTSMKRLPHLHIDRGRRVFDITAAHQSCRMSMTASVPRMSRAPRLHQSA